MPPRARVRNLRALVAVLIVSAAAGVAAHLTLARSEPAAGAVLGASPSRVQLWFTEEPLLPFSRLALSGPGGAVALGPLHAGADRSLTAEVPGRLAPGPYRLVWRTAGDDGHAVDGAVDFRVAAPPPKP